MGYHELTRRELQTLCKQNGLPANKSNAVMASSLTSFFSDQQTITQAYAHVDAPSTAKKPVKTRALPKLERLDTSLASLILAATKPPPKGGQDTLLKICKERVAQSALMVSSSADVVDSTLLLKSTPLRRRKKSDAIKSLPTAGEDIASQDTAQDTTENPRFVPEEISVHTSRTAVKEISIPEPQLAPHFDAYDLVTDKEGHRSTRRSEHRKVASRTELSPPSELEPVASSSAHEQGYSQPVLMKPLLRITANVDTLIRRTTGMLEKFEQWKVDNPNKNAVHGSRQKHLSFDKENLFQRSPYKNPKTRSLQGHMSSDATQLDGKKAILSDIDLNSHA